MHVGLVPIAPGFVRLKPGIDPTLPIDDDPGTCDPKPPMTVDPGMGDPKLSKEDPGNADPTLPIDDAPGNADPTLPIDDVPGNVDPTLPMTDDPGAGGPKLPKDDPGNVDPTLPMTDDPVFGAVPNMLPGAVKEPGAELNAPPPNGDRPKPELGPNVPIVPKGAAKLRGAAASSAAATRDKM
jgi:hypothetical protein